MQSVKERAGLSLGRGPSAWRGWRPREQQSGVTSGRLCPTRPQLGLPTVGSGVGHPSRASFVSVQMAVWSLGRGCPRGHRPRPPSGASSKHRPRQVQRASCSPSSCHQPTVCLPSTAHQLRGRGRGVLLEAQRGDGRKGSMQALRLGPPNFSRVPWERPHLERAVRCAPQARGCCAGAGRARPEPGWLPLWGAQSW